MARPSRNASVSQKLSSYYKGHGRQVMADFQGRYGKKQGTRNFYATVHTMQKGSKAQRGAQPPRSWGPR
jgi:hypothetical protein